ncbi:MAG TPA: DNA methyltransferase, partial [Terriglobales bacterium]|nr:DNA methyltransferase [Terriglobales bacterium]
MRSIKNSTIGEPARVELLDQIKIVGHKNERIVKCFCGEKVSRSIVPHMKNMHSDVWDQWVDLFVYFYNQGRNAKQIIENFKADGRFLFSWSVVESELNKKFQNDPSLLKFNKRTNVKTWEPEEFIRERTTVWSFPRRGQWAVHENSYRGNWPPQLVRNLLLNYTQKNDHVLDLFAGGGTTLIESWLMHRYSIGIDISPISERFIRLKLGEMKAAATNGSKNTLDLKYFPVFIRGDSTNADELLLKAKIPKQSVDLICAHPPYLDALSYSTGLVGELSRITSQEEFLQKLSQVFASAKKVLKLNGIMAVLIGDVRRNGTLLPLGALAI